MSDEEVGAAREPMSCVGEHFPASWAARPSWFGPTDAAGRAEPTDALRRLMGASDDYKSTSVESQDQDAARRLMAVPCEITRLRAQNEALRSEVGGLRLRLESLELTYRAALADAKPARVVSPLHRALAVRPGAFGLRVGMEG